MSNTFTRNWMAALTLALAVAAFAAPLQAANVLPLYLEEIVDTAATAFEGKCTANRSERDEVTHLVVTYTTFDVTDVLKGTPGRSITIKQIGGQLPDQGLQYRVSGVPTFEVGQEYVVFLAGVSSAGFSSPIGLAQGKFSIKSEAGSRRLGNGRDFRDMTARISQQLPATSGLKQSAAAVRDMDVIEFKQIVRARVGGAK